MMFFLKKRASLNSILAPFDWYQSGWNRTWEQPTRRSASYTMCIHHGLSARKPSIIGFTGTIPVSLIATSYLSNFALADRYDKPDIFPAL